MAELSWACAHCGGAFHEPLTLAAKRHGRDPRAVLDAGRILLLHRVATELEGAV
jgi:hypothetical protein